MIHFTDVYKRYPNNYEALSGLTFHLEQGEMAFLTGHSGAGKSTLLKLIALIERSSHGQVLVDNQNLTRLPRRKIPFFRRQIGIVFQDHNLLHDRTVFDNVALPLVIAGESHREIGRRVRAALDKVGGFDEGITGAEDLCLFLRLAEVGKLKNIEQVTYQYRQHVNGECHDNIHYHVDFNFHLRQFTLWFIKHDSQYDSHSDDIWSLGVN